jgi:hypothetical protein
MSETVLGIDLKVTCADHGVHEGVIMKVVDDRVIYLTTDGEELKGDCAVQNISGATFLAGMNVIANAIRIYRGQE